LISQYGIRKIPYQLRAKEIKAARPSVVRTQRERDEIQKAREWVNLHVADCSVDGSIAGLFRLAIREIETPSQIQSEYVNETNQSRKKGQAFAPLDVQSPSFLFFSFSHLSRRLR
ncbi:MAG: hypothetical protein AAGJ35_06250, partial [Myxococcota bacterium]